MIAVFMREVERDTVVKLAQYHSARPVSKLEKKPDLLSANPDQWPSTSPEG